jgi:hypothetical protein
MNIKLVMSEYKNKISEDGIIVNCDNDKTNLKKDTQNNKIALNQTNNLKIEAKLGSYENPRNDPGKQNRIPGEYIYPSEKTIIGNNKNKNGVQKTPNGRFQSIINGTYLGTYNTRQEAIEQSSIYKNSNLDKNTIFLVNKKKTLTKCCLLCKSTVKHVSIAAIELFACPIETAQKWSNLNLQQLINNKNYYDKNKTKLKNDVCQRHFNKKFTEELKLKYSDKKKKDKKIYQKKTCEGITNTNTKCSLIAYNTIELLNGEIKYCCDIHNDLKYFNYNPNELNNNKFICSNCNKSYLQPSSLLRHFKEKHKDIEENLVQIYKSNYCKPKLTDKEDYDIAEIQDDPGFNNRKKNTFYKFKNEIRYWNGKKWKCKHKKEKSDCKKCAIRCKEHNRFKCVECKNIIPYENSYANAPDVKRWHPTKNDKEPTDYYRKSDCKAWFICPDCTEKSGIEHDYYKQLKHNTGCPYCACKKLCDNENCQLCYDRSFKSSVHVKDWAFDKNIDNNGKQINPRQVVRRSHKLYWFKCDVCYKETGIKHYYESAPDYKYANNSGCQYCYSNKLCDNENCQKCFKKSFASHPYSKNWAFDKNTRSPRQISKNDNKKYWFKCDVCYKKTGIEHYTEKSLNMLSGCSSRKAQNYCIYCNNRGLCGNDKCSRCFNKSFADHYRSKFIDQSKSKLDPLTIRKQTHQEVNFICEKGHKFVLTPHAITRNDQWCPYCKTITKAIHWLRYRSISDKIYIQHQLSSEQKEHVIKIGEKQFKLDGFAIENGNNKLNFDKLKESNNQKYAYEFNGDFWHGNPMVFNILNKNSINTDEYRQKLQVWKDEKLRSFDEDSTVRTSCIEKHGSRIRYEDFLKNKIKEKFKKSVNNCNGKSFRTLYYNTLEREKILKNANYIVISIWEKEYDYMIDCINKLIHWWKNLKKT